ncbi:hypothetical protein ACFS07_34305 [Undibacterium arcticum]
MTLFVSPEQARSQLAPSGVLKVGLSMLNILLVKPNTAPGVYEGIAPDLARALASELDVNLQFVPYAKPGPLADAADQGAWDVAFLADDPTRAKNNCLFLRRTWRSLRATWCLLDRPYDISKM